MRSTKRGSGLEAFLSPSARDLLACAAEALGNWLTKSALDRLPKQGPNHYNERLHAKPRMTLSAGTRLGPYQIVAPLGAGGMGEVYRARDMKLVSCNRRN